MNTIFKIIALPITIALLLLTVVLCIPFLWEDISKYSKGEITVMDLSVKVTFTIQNFPTFYYWTQIHPGLRAVIVVVLVLYIF